ncbi:hypothetical protein ACFTTN_14075 [Streptomyces niveus]|uniref:hypothetical protein n=1 Tax=Streptomyces niveus TaxID=193462 RepID=UPI0035E1AD52
MLATTPTLPAVVSKALEAARQAQTQAALLSTELLAELVTEYLPEATTLTVDGTTGAPVAITEGGITAWQAGGHDLLPDTPLVQIQRTVRDLINLSSDPATFTDIGWFATTDGRYVIAIG